MTIPLAPAQRWQDATNRYSLENLTAPAAEPITLDEAKLHLRVDTDDTVDDDLISTLITGVRIQAETICKRIFVTSTWRFSMDHFPYAGEIGPYTFGPEMIPGPIRSRAGYSRNSGEFAIPVSPVQSIDLVTYVDNTGATITVDSAAFNADLLGYPITIQPAFGTSWPAIRAGQNGVQISFTAGYGAPAAVPAPVKAWMKIKVATFYRNREEVALFRGTIQELEFVDRLLDPVRLYEF